MEHLHDPESIRERLAAGPSLSYLRDFVYGGIDGSVTTFAVVTGVVGARLSPTIILILGVANLLADGFSMAASNYLGTRTERHEVDALRVREARHIAVDPEGEREEVRQIFAAKGLAGEDLERVVEVVTSDHERWIDVMITEEYGLAQQVRSARAAAVATFAAFLICGLVPLLPFLFRLPFAFPASAIMTLGVFFAVGSARSRWLILSWWRAGIETLVLGTVAASLAWGAGWLIEKLT